MLDRGQLIVRSTRACLVSRHLSGPYSGCGAPSEELHLPLGGGFYWKPKTAAAGIAP